MEAAWKSIVDDGITWELLGMGSAVSGKDSVWEFRQSLANNSNARWSWTVSVDTSVFVNGMVRSKSQSIDNHGVRTELGDWNATFNDQGMLNYVCEEEEHT